MIRIRRSIAQYYLSFRMSAAMAIPDFAFNETPVAAPIVRQAPARVSGIWDERELLQHGELDWIITRDAGRIEQTTFIWN